MRKNVARKRSNVRLDVEQHKAFKARCRELGISLGEGWRRLIEQLRLGEVTLGPPIDEQGSSEPKIRVCLYLEADTLQWLQSVCLQRRVSQSEAVRRLVAKFLRDDDRG